jgi:hypothetical protein
MSLPPTPSPRLTNYPGLDLLGIDEQTRLHWDGKPIVIEQRFSFSWWQKILAWVVAGAAVVGAIGTVVGAIQGVDAGHNLACKLNLLTSGCPKAAPADVKAPAPTSPTPTISYGSGIRSLPVGDAVTRPPP